MSKMNGGFNDDDDEVKMISAEGEASGTLTPAGVRGTIAVDMDDVLW